MEHMTEPGLQLAIELKEGKPTTDRMIKRPRMVVYCEASIVEEMHELAWKNGRSVSRLGQLAMARFLADVDTGRFVLDPIGRA